MPKFKATTFQVAKTIDKELFATLRAVVNAMTYKLDSVTIHSTLTEEAWTINKDNIDTDQRLAKILGLDGFYINNATFNLSNNAKLQFTRQESWFDNITANPGEEGDFNKAIDFTTRVRESFSPIEPKRTLAKFLDDDAKQHYAAREHALQSLQQMQSDFFRRTQEYVEEQNRRVFEKHQELEKNFDSRKTTLESEVDAKKQELVNERAEFDKKRKEFDDRESKLIRRKITDDLLKILKDRSQTFELTAGTKGRRRIVFGLYVILTVLFGLLAFAPLIRAVVQPAVQEQFDYVVIARQMLFTIAFAVTAGFFLKWTNAWFRSHADEEFNLKRLELDWLRAAWIVEMAIDWKTEKGAEIPQALVLTLARNLFADDKADESHMTAADVLASALFGSSTSAKVKLGDTELSYDRKAIDRLKKDKLD